MARYTPKKQESTRQKQTWTERDVQLMAQIQRAIRQGQTIKGLPEGYDPDDPDTWVKP